MKKIYTYFMICIGSIMLCGCTEYPGMKDSDMDLVAEYAAGLLLEHSKTTNSRLMDVEEALLIMEEEKQEEVEIEPEEEIKDEEPVSEPEEPKQTETPVIDNTEVPEEIVYPVHEVMGLELLSVQFNGYEIKDSYPDGSGAFFALDAGEGNKLLVAKIVLTNNTDSNVDINMLDNNVIFKISLDGNGYKFALSTMLLDDLSTFTGTLGAGSSTELVLISEWNEDVLTTDILVPTLYIKNGELSGTYPIQ